MEKPTKTQELFAVCGRIDSKHKLNVSNLPINSEVIDEIRKEGLTLERIDELISKGYPIFRYKTQVTLHGIANPDDIGRGYVGSYVSLVVNDNKSLGIRWIAVDHDKKRKLANILKLYGWHMSETSQDTSIYRLKRITSKEEGVELATKWKGDMDRYDWNRIYGTYSIHFAKTLFGIYLVNDIIVNGIYREEVEPLACAVCGVTPEELQAKRDEANAEYLRRRKEEEERMEEWRKESAKRDAERKVIEAQRMKEATDALIAQGCVETPHSEIPVGQFGCYPILVGYDFEDNKKLKHNYFIHQDKGWRMCDEKGVPLKPKSKFLDMRNAKLWTKPEWVNKDIAPKVAKPTAKADASTKDIGIVFQNVPTGFIVYGKKTYFLRSKIKELGGKWESKKKVWLFNNGKTVAEVKQHLLSND